MPRSGPRQIYRATCSALVHASNTTARGASNTRVITISRGDGVVTCACAVPPLTAPFLSIKTVHEASPPSADHQGRCLGQRTCLPTPAGTIQATRRSS